MHKVLLDEVVQVVAEHKESVASQTRIQLVRDDSGIALKVFGPSGGEQTVRVTEHTARLLASALAAELAQSDSRQRQERKPNV